MYQKIVVTGLGCYTPIGKNISNFTNNLMNSKSGIKKLEKMNLESLRNDKGAYIEEIDLIETETGQNTDIMLMQAAKEAIMDADLLNASTTNISVSVGTSIFGIAGYIDDIIYNYSKNSKTPLNPYNKLNHHEAILNIPPVLLAQRIANSYSFTGSILSSVTACCAGGNAIAVAKDFLTTGQCDAVVIAGIDTISELTFYGFNALMALTKSELRTMDNNRSGLLIGEGAAVLVLEREKDAKARNAKIYCELSGTGICNEAYHATQPHPEGLGAFQAMKLALKEAGIDASEIDYVNLHGTGTKYNDIMELRALHKLVGEERLETLPISSSKSMLGHTLGAAGVIEAVISVISLHNKIMPPNINSSEMIDGFKYNLIKEATPNSKMNHVMSNSFGFAGNCASLIFSCCE